MTYTHLVQIGPAVTEMQGVENGSLAVPVNNTLVCSMSFLVTYTQPCVLMYVLSSAQMSNNN